MTVPPSQDPPLLDEPPDAVPPEAVPPEVVPPDDVPPELVPPEAVPPDAVPPELVLLEAVPPDAVPPEAVPPDAVPPEAVPPELLPVVSKPRELELEHAAKSETTAKRTVSEVSTGRVSRIGGEPLDVGVTRPRLKIEPAFQPGRRLVLGALLKPGSPPERRGGATPHLPPSGVHSPLPPHAQAPHD